MKRFGLTLTLAAALIACSSATLRAQPAGLPTVADVRADFTAGKYQDVLRKVQQITNSRTANVDPMAKSELLELKAEAQLQLKQTGNAATSFTDAAKETKDEKKASLYKATALLAKRSAGGNYLPKNPVDGSAARGTTRQPPIAITDKASRKEAFKALLNDEIKLITPKMATLGRATSLPPLLEGMQLVTDVRAVELAATEKDVQTAAMLESLSSQAATLMTNALATMSDNVKRITESANKANIEVVNLPNGGTQQVATKNGLNSNDANALQDVISTCDQIVEVCKAVSGSGKGAVAMKTVGTKAESLALNAEQTLKADYGASTSDVSNVIDNTRTRSNTNTRGNVNTTPNNPNPTNRANTRGGY